MPPPPPPSLPEELLEEIFLRLPPDEPEHLVRASLVSKLWLGLLSGARFRGRYHEHHGAPPMLGVLCTWFLDCHPKVKDPIPYFISTGKFGARISEDEWVYSNYDVSDCRHGRVLLGDYNWESKPLVVWDPMTGYRRELRAPNPLDSSYSVAVLCAVSGCDHQACHAGPFRVVLFSLDEGEDGEFFARAWVSLSETGDWSKTCSDLHLTDIATFRSIPPVLVEDALHLMLEYDDDVNVEILKYDLSSNSLSLIAAPIGDSEMASTAILMALEDGSLGFAHVKMFTLYIWSRLMDSNRFASWSQLTVIDLRKLIPVQNPKETLRLVGSVEGSDTVFVTTDLGIYEINVKSQQWKKLWMRENLYTGLYTLIPHMSFYNPQERVMPSDTEH